MEPRRRNPLRRYPTAVCISVLHFGLTQSKARALNSPEQFDYFSIEAVAVAHFADKLQLCRSVLRQT